MRLVTCDRHMIFADALATVVARTGHQIVARVSSPDDALRMIGHDAVDAWLIELPEDGTDEAMMTRLRAAMPDMALVVLTSVTDRTRLRRAVSDGADGVVLKTEPLSELERVLARAIGNRAERTGRAAWSIGAKATSARPAQTRSVDLPGNEIVGTVSLTAKELEVMRRLTNGDSTEAIAEGMGVGVSTVRTHLQHLYGKLQVHSRLELVSIGARLSSSRSLTALAS